MLSQRPNLCCQVSRVNRRVPRSQLKLFLPTSTSFASTKGRQSCHLLGPSNTTSTTLADSAFA